MAFQGFLKQSTAVDILLGPFVDETDGKTAEAGLTISQADVKLSKNGQTLAQKSDATACAVDGSDGYYNCELDATDTNTVGQLTIVCHESGALPVRLDYHVVEEAVYDAMYGGSAAGPLQSTTAGRTLDVSAGGEAGIDWANVGSPTTAVDLSATDIQLCDTVTTNTDMITAAAVNAEVDTALADIHLDHLVSVQDAVADLSATASSFETGLTEASNAWDEAELTFISGNLSGQTRVITDYSVTNGTVTVNEAFTESPANTDAFIIRASHTHSTTQIADFVWDELLAGHVDADSAGLLLNDWQDGGRLDLILDTVATDTTTDIPALIAALNDVAATDIVSGGAITTSGGAVSTVTTATTATNLTNLPTIPSNWLTAAGINASALDGKGDWNTVVPDAAGTAATQAEVASEISDALTVDALVAGVTVVEALRRTGAVVSYKLSGAGTGTETVTDWADSGSTIVFTVDASGNKSAVTFN